MKPSTKVEFIERVDKSLLGLDGLQIIVICDKTSGGRPSNKEDISFQYIGKNRRHKDLHSSNYEQAT